MKRFGWSIPAALALAIAVSAAPAAAQGNSGSHGGGQPLQPFRRDVGERSRDVAEPGERVELGHLGEPEVEQAHVDLR